jgi:beta-mannosidase
MLGSSGDKIDLHGEWRLSSADGEHGAPITLPGDVHSALAEAGLIPDPYFGRNEDLVQWVAERDWVIERSFVVPDADGSWYLDIDYLDTVAVVFVNDVPVLSADNCFRRYRPDVSAALQPGENRIRIVFHSSLAAGAERQARQPFYVPYHKGNSPLAHGNMLRKPQCHFGWDWNIAIAPLGLYGSVSVRKLDPARIEHVETEQFHHADGRVDLRVTATLFAAEPAVVPVHFALDDDRVRLDVGIAAGETKVVYVFEVAGHRCRRGRQPVCAQSERPRDLLPRCQLDTGGRAFFAQLGRWHRGPAAIGGRRPYEHDPGLGWRLLRAGLVLRHLRPARPDGLAGLHVCLQSLSMHRRLPDQCRP